MYNKSNGLLSKCLWIVVAKVTMLPNVFKLNMELMELMKFRNLSQKDLECFQNGDHWHIVSIFQVGKNHNNI